MSDDGRRQVSAAREYLKTDMIAAIYSSPLLRTRETAQILSGPHKNVVVSISEMLNEVYSPYDGSPREEIEILNWNVYNHGKSGYEQPEDVLARAQQFIRVVRLGHLGQRVIAVTHGDLIAFLMLWFKGTALTSDNKQALYEKYLKQGSITIFSFQTKQDDECPRIEYVNPSIEKISILLVGLR